MLWQHAELSKLGKDLFGICVRSKKQMCRDWTAAEGKTVTVTVSFKDMWKSEREEEWRDRFRNDAGGRDFIYPFTNK